MLGTVVKGKVGELEEGIREGFVRRLRKEVIGVVGRVVGPRRYLMRFEDGFKKEPSLNKLTVVTKERIPETEDAEEVDIPVKEIERVDVDKGLYQEVYVLKLF